MADEQERDEKEVQEPKQSSLKPIIFIVLGIVLLGVLGAAGYLSYQALTGENGEEPVADPGTSQPLAAVEPIKLLSKAYRFRLKDGKDIQFQLSVIVAKEDKAAVTEILEERGPQIKDALIIMFMQRTSEELKTPTGSQEFKKELRKRLAEFIEPERIKDILFDEF